MNHSQSAPSIPDEITNGRYTVSVSKGGTDTETPKVSALAEQTIVCNFTTKVSKVKHMYLLLNSNGNPINIPAKGELKLSYSHQEDYYDLYLELENGVPFYALSFYPAQYGSDEFKFACQNS
ncbi:MAG: hypothetical protein V4714_02965 [Bacteroidota bacterium]